MTEEVSGIVLAKNLSGENGLLYKIFSARDGLATLYKRTSAKKTSQLPDIFDEVTARATPAKGGDLLFMDDAEIIRRRTGLAKNYDSFCSASGIAKMLLKNSRYLEHFGELYAALTGSLDALEAGADADVVKIKFLYIFARDEGYPVKESFMRSLMAEDFNMLAQILSTPSAQCSIPAQKSAQLLMHLERWLYSATDIEEG